jgi:histidine triad (HIT) family protein
MDCIFCGIVRGDIPSVKVYEDDRTFAFMDINPLNEGHLLIIPKTHAATIHEMSEADFAAVMSVTHKLAAAVKKTLNPDGINLMQLNGEAANQVVPHLHVHIVPRWSGDGLAICKWDPSAGDMARIKAVGEQIQEALP